MFEARFPADFICEAIDQTRGWFYSLLAVNTLVFDQRAVPERRVPRPHRRRTTARRCRSRSGNIIAPWEVLDRHGADALRWYFLTSKQPWDGYQFSTEAVGESLRQFLLQLWNTYGFFVMYANVDGVAR